MLDTPGTFVGEESNGKTPTHFVKFLFCVPNDARCAYCHFPTRSPLREEPRIDEISYDRVVKGAAVTYTVTGFGLWDDPLNGQYVKVVPANVDCGSDDDVLGGGAGVQFDANTISEDRTSAKVTFTLTDAAVSAKFCMKSPTSTSPQYAAPSNSPTVTVIDITSIKGGDATFNEGTPSQTLFAPNGVSTIYTLTSSLADTLNLDDMVKFVTTPSCDGDGLLVNDVGGGQSKSIAQVVAGAKTAQTAQTTLDAYDVQNGAGTVNITVCLKAGTASSPTKAAPNFHKVGITITLGKQVSRVSTTIEWSRAIRFSSM